MIICWHIGLVQRRADWTILMGLWTCARNGQHFLSIRGDQNTVLCWRARRKVGENKPDYQTFERLLFGWKATAKGMTGTKLNSILKNKNKNKNYLPPPPW